MKMGSNITGDDYMLLMDEISMDFPDFEVIKKSDSTLMKAINIALRIITFNQMKTFMTSFTTTLGNTVYVPESWDIRDITSRWITLSHERVHMEQAKKYGRLWFSILYMLCLPALFAFYRTKFEKEAYEVSLRCQYQAYGPASFTDSSKGHVVDHFTTGQYLWMWILSSGIEEWYDEVVLRIHEEDDHDDVRIREFDEENEEGE